jgi:creatinine amidohydrolase
MPSRPYILEETNWQELRDMTCEVAVLPWGATEAHNLHLPYGTDTMQSAYIAAEAARLASEEGERVMVLPAVPFGVQTGQLDIPFCLNMNPSTQAALLSDLVQSLAAHGVRKLVVLNGHGGNDFRQMIRELQPRVDVFLCAVNWYRVGNPADFFDVPGDHAGEMETSFMLHVAPTLVRPLAEAGDGAERKPRLRAMREGWAWAPRRWTQISTDTGVGDPRAATSEKGARYVEAVAAQVGAFLVELARADTDDLYDD